jgi:hypothetical protein
MEMILMLEDRRIGIRFLVAKRHLSLHDSVQTVFGAHPAPTHWVSGFFPL